MDPVKVKNNISVEQCMMSGMIPFLAEKNKDEVYPHFTIMEGPSFDVLSKIHNTKFAKKLFNISPAQLALLVPKILFFKVEEDAEGTMIDIPMPFRTHLNSDSLNKMTAEREGRGDDVGLKSFSYEFQGSYYAILGRSVRTKTVLYFSDIKNIVSENLLVTGCGTKKGYASFSDLFIRSVRGNGCFNGKMLPIEFNPDYFRMKVIMGWSVPPKNELFDDELMMAIENSSIVLFLDVIKYELTFNQDASVELTIEHIGAIENIVNSTLTNILMLSNDFEEAMARLQEDEFKRLDEKKEGHLKIIDDKTTIKVDQSEAKKATEFVISTFVPIATIPSMPPFTKIENQNNISYIEKGYQYIVDLAHQKSRIFSVNIPKDKFAQMRADLKYIDVLSEAEADDGANKLTIEKIKQKYKDDYLKVLESELKSGTISITNSMSLFDVETSTSHNILFMYFGDILEAVLNNLYEKHLDQFLKNNITIITGEFINGINLADIPIRLSDFENWFREKIIKPRLRKYNFKNFFNDIVNDLLIPTINGSCFGIIDQFRVSTDIFAMPQINGKSIFTPSNTIVASQNFTQNAIGVKPEIVSNGRININNVNQFKNINSLFSLIPYKSNKNIEHVVFIYTCQGNKSNRFPNIDVDFDDGIYHFFIGKDNGLIKNISFNATSNAYLPESRAEHDGDFLASQIIERYSCSIEMVGNTLFKPGMMFYINPTFLGDIATKKMSRSRRLGFGGYYFINKVSTKYSDSKYTTQLEGIWQTFGKSDEEILDQFLGFMNPSKWTNP